MGGRTRTPDPEQSGRILAHHRRQLVVADAARAHGGGELPEHRDRRGVEILSAVGRHDCVCRADGANRCGRDVRIDGLVPVWAALEIVELQKRAEPDCGVHLFAVEAGERHQRMGDEHLRDTHVARGGQDGEALGRRQVAGPEDDVGVAEDLEHRADAGRRPAGIVGGANSFPPRSTSARNIGRPNISTASSSPR
jgi:hypothetical protein